MKECRTCKELKDKTQFNKSLDCKSCKRFIMKKNKLQVNEIKSKTPCTDCNHYYPYYVMQFDHIGAKNFNLARCQFKSWDLVAKEIEQCEIVCANCHAIRTYNRAIK